jgi:hypothetical protein
MDRIRYVTENAESDVTSLRAVGTRESDRLLD